METRDFPAAVIASLSTGVLLCDFSDMHEAAEFLMGHPIWTHHFADKELNIRMKKAIVAQCPNMPTELPGVTRENYLEKLVEIESKVGKIVRIRKGGGKIYKPEDGFPPT